MDSLTSKSVTMKKLVVLLSILSLNFYACNNKTSFESSNDQKEKDDYTNDLSYYTDTSNIEILALNDMAVQLLQKSQRYKKDMYFKDSLLREALKYVNLALEKDSNFYNAYLNKSAVLRGFGQYEESIEPLQELLSRKIFPEAIFTLGLLYEKIGKQDLADKNYREAYIAYGDYLKTPISTERDKMNKDYILLFLEGKEKVLKDINEKIKNDPNNTSLLIDKKIIEEFNREEFIANL